MIWSNISAGIVSKRDRHANRVRGRLLACSSSDSIFRGFIYKLERLEETDCNGGDFESWLRLKYNVGAEF